MEKLETYGKMMEEGWLMNVNHQVTLRIGQLLQVAISFHKGSADQQVQGATGADPRIGSAGQIKASNVACIPEI